MDYNFTKEAEDIPSTERTIKPHLFASNGSSPGWFTINLAGSFTFPGDFAVRIKAENLLDLHYRPYSSGISAQGRNFSVALNKTF